MRFSLVWPSLFIATSVAASPLAELGARHLELEATRDLKVVSPEADEIVDTSGLPFVRLAGFAQLAAGTEQQAGIGAAGAISGINCNFVDASAQAYLRASSDDALGGVADAKVCPARYIVSFLGEGHAAMKLAPRLADRGDRWRRRYDELAYRLSFGIGEFFDQRETAPSRHSLLHFGAGDRVTRQDDAGERVVMNQIEIFGTLYRYRDSSLTLDVISASSRATKGKAGDKGSVVNQLEAFHLELATEHIRVNARAGWAKTGGRVMTSGSSSSWMETYDATGLPSLSGPVGEVSVGGTSRGVEIDVAVGRTIFPTIDGNLSREDRATGSFAITRSGFRAQLSPFVARTQMWVRDEGSSVTWSTGASLDIGRELVRHVRLDAIIEAGVSPYARLDGDRRAINERGGQALLVMTAAAGM